MMDGRGRDIGEPRITEKVTCADQHEAEETRRKIAGEFQKIYGKRFQIELNWPQGPSKSYAGWQKKSGNQLD